MKVLMSVGDYPPAWDGVFLTGGSINSESGMDCIIATLSICIEITVKE